MPELTEKEKQAFWDEVKAEFPEDEMMQEVHFTRLVHHHLTKGMTREEKIRFYNAAVNQSPSTTGS